MGLRGKAEWSGQTQIIFKNELYTWMISDTIYIFHLTIALPPRHYKISSTVLAMLRRYILLPNEIPSPLSHRSGYKFFAPFFALSADFIPNSSIRPNIGFNILFSHSWGNYFYISISSCFVSMKPYNCFQYICSMFGSSICRYLFL